MVVAFMQILDTSVTNVILPHLQDHCRRARRVSWVITSYLAANAWSSRRRLAAGLFGRRRFFLICATLFVVSSFISGAAPTDHVDRGAHLQASRRTDHSALAGDPLGDLPVSPARPGDAVWASASSRPILGRTVAATWRRVSWRWIFYITCRRIVGFFLAVCSCSTAVPASRRADRLVGLGLMVAGFAACSWSSIGASARTGSRRERSSR